MNHIPASKYGKNKIADILLKYNYQIKIGDILAGQIVGIERKEILVDLGFRQTAYLPNNEILINLNQTLAIPKFNEFVIVSYNFQTHLTIISLRKLHAIRLWERFKQINYNNIILFTELQKKPIWGGKLVKFDELKSFIPNFHLPKFYRRKRTRNELLPVKVLEVKNRKHTIITSARLAFFKSYSPSLQTGVIQKGYVIGIKPFGIFLNIYGFRSLLHISEISDKRIKNINHFYKKGDQLTVKVIYINNSKGKIAVSLKKNQLSTYNNV